MELVSGALLRAERKQHSTRRSARAVAVHFHFELGPGTTNYNFALYAPATAKFADKLAVADVVVVDDDGTNCKRNCFFGCEYCRWTDDVVDTC